MHHLAVTLMSSLLPNETGGLAHVMLHNKRIQHGVENDLSRTSKNVQTSTLLSKLMTRQPITEEDLQENDFGIFYVLSEFF